MNAILREEHEAPVLTLEQIEVHLSYMRPGLDAANAALPVLRDKLEALSEKMSAKIEKVDSKIDHLAEKVESKIDQLSARTDAKIDQANRDRADGDAMLAEKIDQANKDRAAGDDALAAKIDATNANVVELSKTVHVLGTKMNILLWLVGGAITGGTFFLTVGKAIGWF